MSTLSVSRFPFPENLPVIKGQVATYQKLECSSIAVFNYESLEKVDPNRVLTEENSRMWEITEAVCDNQKDTQVYRCLISFSHDVANFEQKLYQANLFESFDIYPEWKVDFFCSNGPMKKSVDKITKADKMVSYPIIGIVPLYENSTTRFRSNKGKLFIDFMLNSTVTTTCELTQEILDRLWNLFKSYIIEHVELFKRVIQFEASTTTSSSSLGTSESTSQLVKFDETNNTMVCSLTINNISVPIVLGFNDYNHVYFPLRQATSSENSVNSIYDFLLLQRWSQVDRKVLYFRFFVRNFLSSVDYPERLIDELILEMAMAFNLVGSSTDTIFSAMATFALFFATFFVNLYKKLKQLKKESQFPGLFALCEKYGTINYKTGFSEITLLGLVKQQFGQEFEMIKNASQRRTTIIDDDGNTYYLEDDDSESGACIF